MRSRIVCAFLLTCVALPGVGQHFSRVWTESLSTPLTSPEVHWVRLDQDTLLDIVLVGRTLAGELYIHAYQNTPSSLTERSSLATGFESGTVQLADWNRDNRMDILISGKTLQSAWALYVFENKGDFTFQRGALIVEHAGQFRMVDFDGDGFMDLLTAGAADTLGNIRVYANQRDRLLLVYDSLQMQIRDLVIGDLDGDGLPDFVVSGNSNTVPVMLQFVQEGKFRFRAKAIESPLAGRLSAIDRNADGRVDLLAAGTSSEGKELLSEWRNDGVGFRPLRSSPAPLRASLFTGDMNSDGVPDKLVSGTDSMGRHIGYVETFDTVHIPLATAGLLLQCAGDADFDGDLDVLQVMDSANRTWMTILINEAPVKNAHPLKPSMAFAISTYNRTFLFWEASTDDHTKKASLTYDVWLGTAEGTLVTADFDLGTGQRMSVTHGNAGMRQSKMVRGLTDDRYFYLIQTVDNAYSGSYRSGQGGLCTGGVLPCFDLVHEELTACRNSLLTMQASSKAYWFSSSRGFLAMDSTYTFTASENDTIFAFVPQQGDCSKNKIWTIQAVDGPSSKREIVYTCLDQTVNLSIDPGWESNRWDTLPAIVNQGSIRWTVDEESTLVVNAVAPGGCTYQHVFDIRISTPTLALNGDAFRIKVGNSVSLEAISSATHFRWAPSEGLSNAEIANPIATPRRNINYVVTATDSAGCTITGAIEVWVDEAAVVPNLFTPNGDGSNDNLLVYGITDAIGFSFRIYNREGATVYETFDLDQLRTTGWNGVTRGLLQPSGVYYWKVEGRTPNGDPLLFNGVTMGSVLLVH